MKISIYCKDTDEIATLEIEKLEKVGNKIILYIKTVLLKKIWQNHLKRGKIKNEN